LRSTTTSPPRLAAEHLGAKGLVEEMKRLLRSSEERADMVARGLANAARFSWRRAARKTMATYEAALNDRRR
jgi:glycosyltransferase involved in cell wall biosynthesis